MDVPPMQKLPPRQRDPEAMKKHEMKHVKWCEKCRGDGIADALGIDDHRFKTSFDVCEPVKGGAVRVTIQERAQ